MKLTAFLTYALFAAGICAATRPAHRAERLVGRGPFSSRLQLLGDHTYTVGTDAPPTDSNTGWAGAALPNPPAGKTFTSATGVITVPAAGAAGTSVVVWIGFDGFDSEPPLVQGGIDILVEDDGTATYQSWTEWVPDPPVFYDQMTFPFTTGDQLNITITTQAGSNQATLVIENNTSGASLTKAFSPSDTLNVAKGLSAEWVVERVPGSTLSNFGTITFSRASAATANTQVDLTGATVMEIETRGRIPIVIVTSSITDANTVVVTYTGP